MSEHFGTTAAGRAVSRITISSGSLTARILTLGVCVNDVRLAGVPHSLTLGFDGLEPYEGALFHGGTLMGPVVNRIAGAEAVIDGTTFQFDKNMQDAHTIHGGSAATHSKVWDIADQGASHVTLTTLLPDGEGGFPGNRPLSATFVVEETTLTMRLTAATDAPTLINLANHSYWNLGPQPTIAGHSLQIPAAHFLPADPKTVIATGEIAPVEGTRFDYRKPRALEAGAEGLLDNNFCIAQERSAPRTVARLTGPNGVSMRMDSTEPGLQVFDGHSLARANALSTDGVMPVAYAGLALEAQFWPNAPHNPSFPDITLRPGQAWTQETSWTFSAQE